MNARTVLFADDSERDTELALEALRECGLDAGAVAVVRDGVEALDYLRARARAPPALLLLDLQMPKLSGLEVLRAVKSDPALRALPVVVMTSSQEESDLAECYVLGANAFVVKPLGYEGLVRAMRGLGQFWLGVNEPPPGFLLHPEAA